PGTRGQAGPYRTNPEEIHADTRPRARCLVAVADRGPARPPGPRGAERRRRRPVARRGCGDVSEPAQRDALGGRGVCRGSSGGGTSRPAARAGGRDGPGPVGGRPVNGRSRTFRCLRPTGPERVVVR